MRQVIRRVIDWYKHSPSTLALWLRAANQALLGDMQLLASGTTLYGILATVPALGAAVGLYSLVADPGQIHGHLESLATVLPPAVATFIGEQLQRQAARSHNEIGVAILVSTLLALWSARSATRGIMDTLNRAYRVRERRGPVARFGITMAITTAILLGLMLFFAAIVVLPTLIAITGLESLSIMAYLRWPVLFVVVFFALMLLYRFAPSPRPLGTELHLWPGAFIATVLLFAVSLGLSFWVDRVTDYNVFYGAFGSVVVTILWFYFTTISVVLGGFANAELERRDGAPQPDFEMY